MRPRLSWWLPAGIRTQRAYRIRTGAWDSGRVGSDQSVLVPYDGPQLPSGERVEWSVMVWTDAGESDWAEPGWWEMGLLDPSDWVARWVEPDVETEGAPVRAMSPPTYFISLPTYLLRHRFVLDEPAKSARRQMAGSGGRGSS